MTKDHFLLIYYGIEWPSCIDTALNTYSFIDSYIVNVCHDWAKKSTSDNETKFQNWILEHAQATGTYGYFGYVLFSNWFRKGVRVLIPLKACEKVANNLLVVC